MTIPRPRFSRPLDRLEQLSLAGAALSLVGIALLQAWQVFGRSATTFQARVQFDDTYYRKLSMIADLGLILRTVKVVVCRTGK